MSRGRSRIVLSAGEPSGDRLGAGLARELRRRYPDVELVGMGGDRMAAEGVKLVQHLRDVAVVGISEVVSHLPRLLRARRRLLAALDGATLFVPIDFPDFHFVIGRAAHARSVPVAYFVSPQLWAWRRGRVRSLRRWVRRMLVLFPFEEAFYREAGIDVRFVGHPLAEEVVHPDRAELAARLDLDPDAVRVALMPGSRTGEVTRLFPVMAGAARALAERDGGLRFLVPVAPHIDGDAMAASLAPDLASRFDFRRGAFPELLDLCRAGAVAAGTASLEAAVQGLPIVIVHRLSAVSYAIGRRLVSLEHVGLPNLIAGREVVPERIQDACRPDVVAADLARYLEDATHRQAVRRELAGLRERLGGAGVYGRAADAISDWIDPD